MLEFNNFKSVRVIIYTNFVAQTAQNLNPIEVFGDMILLTDILCVTRSKFQTIFISKDAFENDFSISFYLEHKYQNRPVFAFSSLGLNAVKHDLIILQNNEREDLMSWNMPENDT